MNILTMTIDIYIFLNYRPTNQNKLSNLVTHQGPSSVFFLFSLLSSSSDGLVYQLVVPVSLRRSHDAILLMSLFPLSIIDIPQCSHPYFRMQLLSVSTHIYQVTCLQCEKEVHLKKKKVAHTWHRTCTIMHVTST